MLPDSGFLVGTFQPVSDPLDFELPVDGVGSYSENGEPETLAYLYPDYIGWIKDGGEILVGTGDGTIGNIGSQVRLIITRIGGVALLDAFLMPPTTYIQLAEDCPDTTIVDFVEDCNSGYAVLDGVDTAIDVPITEETATPIVEIA